MMSLLRVFAFVFAVGKQLIKYSDACVFFNVLGCGTTVGSRAYDGEYVLSENKFIVHKRQISINISNYYQTF